MHVHVNQTRHQIPVLKIDHRIAVQVRVILYDGSNYFAVCQNRFPALRLHVLRAVENHAVCECIFHRCHLLFKSMRPFYHSFARFRQFFAMQKHSKIRNVPFPRPYGQPEILRQKTVAIFRRRWYDNKANYAGFDHKHFAIVRWRDAWHRSFWQSQKKMRRDTEAAQPPEYSRTLLQQLNMQG